MAAPDFLTVMPPKERAAEFPDPREELVHRVAGSITLAKSPRLRAFFLHVCRCALEDKPEEATEQQIGMYVYGRPAGYNPNDDNIVRSQARVLRMKLEHHFANEGKDEPIVITIPKGQYVPVFEARPMEAVPRLTAAPSPPRSRTQLPVGLVLAGSLVLGVLVLGVVYLLKPGPSGHRLPVIPAGSISPTPQVSTESQGKPASVPAASGIGEVRIAAGQPGSSGVDAWGQRWASDRYFQGGVVRPGPQSFFPPVADEALFRNIREARSGSDVAPQAEREFRYNIPLNPGVYELRLFFADPLRQSAVDTENDAQNQRHFNVEANGHPLLVDFDPIADGGASAVDVRVFRDLRPGDDGVLHLNFSTLWGQPAFVSAIELTPGIPGRLKPIRIAALRSGLVDSDGMRWSGDRYFIFGRTFFVAPQPGSVIPAFYAGERHGNFSYAIPVPPGSYTVRLHFMESFFTPQVRAAECHGAGCRVFDVTCNGMMLLQNFDIYQAGGGAFIPVVREFHGLHPNGQGKLLISFSPKINYAEVRAIEVIDEAK